MHNQSSDPRNPSASESKNPRSEKEREQDQRQEHSSEGKAEGDKREVNVIEQEQNKAINKSDESSGSGTGMTDSGKEKSFYKNDLPENEEGTDVDERSREIRP